MFMLDELSEKHQTNINDMIIQSDQGCSTKILGIKKD